VRILLVDDDRSFVDTVAEGLELAGWRVQAEADGPSAAMLLCSEHFDVLVSAIRMPTLDGMTLLARSKQLAPERPVILMTSFASDAMASHFVRRGAFHCLSKPFAVRELDTVLKRALRS
jgi:DNA-binding NtrC family response regulator